jgi:hypothetical protein
MQMNIIVLFYHYLKVKDDVIYLRQSGLIHDLKTTIDQE